mmetsp:Transcript_64858/g.201079  ORF Transcript_64858/g.201079 Transcript_64858/m.201079 type:complete len:242 (+) Transcript_64858:1302-2027(+)
MEKAEQPEDPQDAGEPQEPEDARDGHDAEAGAAAAQEAEDPDVHDAEEHEARVEEVPGVPEPHAPVRPHAQDHLGDEDHGEAGVDGEPHGLVERVRRVGAVVGLDAKDHGVEQDAAAEERVRLVRLDPLLPRWARRPGLAPHCRGWRGRGSRVVQGRHRVVGVLRRGLALLPGLCAGLALRLGLGLLLLGLGLLLLLLLRDLLLLRLLLLRHGCLAASEDATGGGSGRDGATARPAAGVAP